VALEDTHTHTHVIVPCERTHDIDGEKRESTEVLKEEGNEGTSGKWSEQDMTLGFLSLLSSSERTRRLFQEIVGEEQKRSQRVHRDPLFPQPSESNSHAGLLDCKTVESRHALNVH